MKRLMSALVLGVFLTLMFCSLAFAGDQLQDRDMLKLQDGSCLTVACDCDQLRDRDMLKLQDGSCLTA